MSSLIKMKTSIIAGLLGMVLAGSALANDAPTKANTDAVSLKQAVAIAQKYTGAEAIEVEREVEANQAFYQVKLVNDQGRQFDTIINATSGDLVLNKEKNKLDADDLVENVAWASGVKNGKIKSLMSAVNTAEERYKAQVYDIEFEDDYGIFEQKMAYEIKLVDAKGKKINTHVLAI